ncbi:isochorismatase family protein [Parashewanella curva]|uniref:nicotinamidase n=1 Tax=Parashewanella curva TaxID=2338552 RepID=A0A3L8Q251_9GAMM|nr:isochorismatase family protein [Parashewanella curva]
MRLPNRSQIASLDVDAQNCFTPLCPDELPVPDGHLIVDELNLQASFADVRVGSKDAHPKNALWETTDEKPILTPVSAKNVDLHWPRHAIVGTFGSELIKGLPKPEEYDYFVWKGIERDLHPYGCCYHDLTESLSTGIIEYLSAKGIKTILVGGLALEHCVMTSALQLSRAGFDVVVNLKATKGLDSLAIEQAIKQMKTKNIKFIDGCDQLMVTES